MQKVDVAALPLASEAELDTLPVGLYAVVDGDGQPRRETRDMYSLDDDELTTGPARLLARIRDSRDFPLGVELITVRPDGKQIIQYWVVEPTDAGR